MYFSPDKKNCSCWYCGGEMSLLHDLRGEVDKEAEPAEPALILKCVDCDAFHFFTEYVSEDGEEFEPQESEEIPDNCRCPLCGGYVIWGSDFNLDEVFDIGKDGIATYSHCMKCGCERLSVCTDEKVDLDMLYGDYGCDTIA